MSSSSALDEFAVGALAMISPLDNQRFSSGTLEREDNERAENIGRRAKRRPYDEYNNQPYTNVYLNKKRKHLQHDPAVSQSISLTYREYNGQPHTTPVSHNHEYENPRHIFGQSTALKHNRRDERHQNSAVFQPSTLVESSHRTGNGPTSTTFSLGQQFELSPLARTIHNKSADLVSSQQALSDYLPPQPMESHVIYKPRPKVDPAWIRYFRNVHQGPIGKDISLPSLIFDLPTGSGPKLLAMEPPVRAISGWEEERWFVENPTTLDITLKLRERQIEEGR
jgi:hypothetical protein